MPELDDAPGHWPVERIYSSGIWHAVALKIDRDAPFRRIEVSTLQGLVGCGCDQMDASNAKDHPEIGPITMARASQSP
jgi:hypothetical protein